jgi:hypothetical protein
MEQTNRHIWMASIVAATATGAIGLVHLGYPLSLRFFLAMPGLLIGLLSGRFVSSPIPIIPVTIGSNALFYFGIAKAVLFLSRRKGAD